VEPFVHQIVGWREFMRGMYRHHGTTMSRRNFWGHERGLTSHWYTGNTGIEPLDHVIRKAGRLGWANHNERLMVVGNLMLLAEIDPRHAYRWFMEMFADSAHWVTSPNVFGVALFADGGLLSGKPQICGSNYLMRMGDYPRGDWVDVVDGLYVRFISRNSAWFGRQKKLSVIMDNLERMPAERRRRLERRAAQFLRDKTVQAKEVA
jgi:deoxyribodipyrimidine photolyase-related protein